MKYFILVSFLLLAQSVAAADYFFLTPQVQYEVLSMGSDPKIEREYYGELKEYPVMYEIVSQSDFTLRALLEQPVGIEPIPLSLLVVRVLENGRVETVVRQAARDTVWLERKDQILGMNWWGGDVYESLLKAGTYRIEVSSPLNEGKYRLTVGDTERPIGYFATWKRLLAVNDFLDRSTFSLIASYFVLVHVVVAACLWTLWRYCLPWWRRRQASMSHD